MKSFFTCRRQSSTGIIQTNKSPYPSDAVCPPETERVCSQPKVPLWAELWSPPQCENTTDPPGFGSENKSLPPCLSHSACLTLSLLCVSLTRFCSALRLPPSLPPSVPLPLSLSVTSEGSLRHVEHFTGVSVSPSLHLPTHRSAERKVGDCALLY